MEWVSLPQDLGTSLNCRPRWVDTTQLIGDSDDAHLLRTNAGSTRMNAVSQANELPKLAKQLIGYKPHSRIMPRCEAVKLWRELKALGYEREGEDVDLVKLEGMVEHCFTFSSMGSRTRIGWSYFNYADHGCDEDFDPKQEGVDDCSDIDFKEVAA